MKIISLVELKNISTQAKDKYLSSFRLKIKEAILNEAKLGLCKCELPLERPMSDYDINQILDELASLEYNARIEGNNLLIEW